MGTLNNRCRITKGTQKGTVILTTAHIWRHQFHLTHKSCVSCALGLPHLAGKMALPGAALAWELCAAAGAPLSFVPHHVAEHGPDEQAHKPEVQLI